MYAFEAEERKQEMKEEGHNIPCKAEEEESGEKREGEEGLLGSAKIKKMENKC